MMRKKERKNIDQEVGHMKRSIYYSNSRKRNKSSSTEKEKKRKRSSSKNKKIKTNVLKKTITEVEKELKYFIFIKYNY